MHYDITTLASMTVQNRRQRAWITDLKYRYYSSGPSSEYPFCVAHLRFLSEYSSLLPFSLSFLLLHAFICYILFFIIYYASYISPNLLYLFYISQKQKTIN